MKIIKFLIFFTSISFVNAQSFVDLKVRINSPADNSTMAPMTPFNLGVTVTNLGSTPFMPEDSLALYIICGNDSVWFFVNGHLEKFTAFTGISLNQGDSTTFSTPFAFDTSFGGKAINLCVFVNPFNRNTNAIRDTLLGNNKSCALVNVEDVSSIRPQSKHIQDINVYPNPGNDYITIESDHVIEKVNIIDCFGKETSIQPSYLNIMDCSRLPCGVYTMFIHSESGIAYKKLIINR